jgi:urea carboxylase
VEAGQTLIIVEAMKMELAIHAPQAGVVKRIGCQPGRPVSPGDACCGWNKERYDEKQRQKAPGRAG